MSDVKGRGLTATVKYGKGYDETWVSFSGSPSEIREDIIDFFGANRDNAAAMTLNELVIAVTDIAHGAGSAAAVLGAMPVPTAPSEPEATETTTEAQESPWDAARRTQAAPEPASDPLLEQIVAAGTRDDLRRLWANNQEAFKRTEVQEAFRARSEAIAA